MTIKKVTTIDAKALSELVISLAHFYIDGETISLPVWLSQTLTPEAFDQRISSDQYTQFVYVIENEIVGYIAFRGREHLFHLFTHKDFQQRGIAQKLWQHAINELNPATVTVRSSIFAVPVYEKFGFICTNLQQEKDGLQYQSMKWKKVTSLSV